MPKINEKINIKGEVFMFKLPGWLSLKSNNPEIVEATKQVLDIMREFIKTGEKNIDKFLKLEPWILAGLRKDNIIVTVGRTVLSERLAGGTTNTGEINYGALGTAVAPVPANGDTQLGNEVFRKLVTAQTFDENIAYIDFFYESTDCDGTYTEFGNFIDGEAGANTGKLWSYIATGGWTKSNTESLYIACKYTIT
jgi:hypothetical protein